MNDAAITALFASAPVVSFEADIVVFQRSTRSFVAVKRGADGRMVCAVERSADAAHAHVACAL